MISVLTCHSSTSLFPGTRLYRGSLEDLYLSQEHQVVPGQSPHCSHKMCRSVSMANVKLCSLKPFKEGPQERFLSQDGWRAEASAAAVVSYRASSEHGSECDRQASCTTACITAGPVLGEVVNRTDSLPPVSTEGGRGGTLTTPHP